MKKPIFKYSVLKPFILVGLGIFNIGFFYLLSTTFYKDSIDRRKKFKKIQSEIINDVPDEQKDEFIEKILREYRKKN